MNTNKSGFGIMEVLAAAVVLGFLIVGLTRLQMGNRESIMRIRTRDAANFVAQYVLDSLSSLGIKSIEKQTFDGEELVLKDTLTYEFKGITNVRDTANSKIGQNIRYIVKVSLLEDNDKKVESINSTYLTEALYRKQGEPEASDEEKNIYAKNLEAVVSWKYKDSEQSIRMAKVVR